MDRPSPGSVDRSRIAWGGFLLVLGTVAALFVGAFVGTFVLGLFFYYAVRPLHRWLSRRTGRRWVAASLAVLIAVLPVIGLVYYGTLVAVREFVAVFGPGLVEAVFERLPGSPRDLETLVRSPGVILSRLDDPARLRGYLLGALGTLGSAANALLHLTLAIAFAFFLLRDGHRLSAWFREDVAGDDEVAEAYVTAVDADLQTVYFGNVLTVLAVGVAALVVYHGFNLLSPPAARIPAPTLLALLTGVATFVPLVVGKLVYVPVTGYLAWRVVRAGAGIDLLSWVGAFLVVSFLVLDLVPQTFVRPLVSGQSLHGGLVLFAYVLGAALFGWYGLFLGPLVVVLVVQAANVVLPEVLHGDRLTRETHLSIGSDPDRTSEAGSGASASSDPDDSNR